MKKNRRVNLNLLIITTILIITTLTLACFLVRKLKDRVKVRKNEVDKIIEDLDSLSNYLD